MSNFNVLWEDKFVGKSFFFFTHCFSHIEENGDTALCDHEIISGQSILILISRREQKSRGAKCVLLLLITLLKFL